MGFVSVRASIRLFRFAPRIGFDLLVASNSLKGLRFRGFSKEFGAWGFWGYLEDERSEHSGQARAL